MDGGPVVVLTKVKLWKKAKLVFWIRFGDFRQAIMIHDA